MGSQAASPVKAVCDGEQVVIDWGDGAHDCFDCLWLRDNCRCEDCGDPAVGYRRLRLTDIDPDCAPDRLDADADGLAIVWRDGHRSYYSSAWLRQHAYDHDSRSERAFKPTLWDDTLRASPPELDYAAVAADDRGLFELLRRVRDFGLCFIADAPRKPGIAEALTRRFGYPQESNFGRVQDLIFDPEQKSIAFDVKALKPHTDEPYRASPPGLLLFHCINNDQTGAGASLFMDGFELAERLRAEDSDGFDALCRNPQRFRRHFDNDVDLIAEFPTLSLDPFGNLSGIRLNDRVAAPLSIAAQQLRIYYRGLRRLLELAESEALMLKRTLKPGDIAVFDNHRILHGRSDLTIHGKRWLQWIQIERGDFHSSLRILADRLGIERDCEPLLRGAYG